MRPTHNKNLMILASSVHETCEIYSQKHVFTKFPLKVSKGTMAIYEHHIINRWKAYHQSLQRYGPETNNAQITLFDLSDLEK
jgi:hypothetical protein